MSANLNKEKHYYINFFLKIFYHLPKESSTEVSRIVISPEDAAKLGIEDVFHLASAKRNCVLF